jgi:hypothetical protein
MTLYLLPAEGLRVLSPWQVGAVRFLPSEHAQALVRAAVPPSFYRRLTVGELSQPWHDLLEWASAAVQAESIEEAIGLLGTATDIPFRRRSSAYLVMCSNREFPIWPSAAPRGSASVSWATSWDGPSMTHPSRPGPTRLSFNFLPRVLEKRLFVMKRGECLATRRSAWA